jgi:membrane protease YdiL (CAAX protease family)
MNERTLELGGLVLGCLSPVLLALGVWYFRPGVRRFLVPPQRQRAVSWSAAEILVAYVLYRLVWPLLIAQVLIGSGLFFWLYGPEFLERIKNADAADHELSTTRLALWVQTVAFPLQLVSIPLLFYLASGTRLYQLGLTLHRAGRNFLAGVLAWFTLTPFVLALNWFVGWVYQTLLHGVPEEHPLTRLGQQSLAPGDWLLLVFSAIVVAGVMEELLFRGVVQPWFALDLDTLIPDSWKDYCREVVQPWMARHRRSRVAGSGALWLIYKVSVRWMQRRPGRGILGIAAALIISVADRISPISLGWKQAGVAGALHGLAPVLFVLAMVPPFFLLGRLRRSHPAGAIYGSALFFAAAHSFAWPTPVALFVLGLGLGYLAYRTQSLVPSITVHGLFNGVACAMLLLPHVLPPTPEPEKGNETTSATRFDVPASTSTTVPGSWLPRRTYASAMAPCRGDTTDEVTCPTSLPSRSTRDPGGAGSRPWSLKPRSVRLTWPRSRAMTIGSWPR